MSNATQAEVEASSTGGDVCWFCDEAARQDPPPGGWLIDEGAWRAGAVPASYAVPGTVVLEARRHVLDQASFNEEELRTCGEVTGRLLRAVRTATDCDRVYQWATMDAYEHFHLWLLPWWTSSTEHGPRYLMSSVFDLEPDEQATRSAATRIADALAAGR